MDRQALAQEESFRFDCKRVKKDLTKILETVVAFANSKVGTTALGLGDPDKAKGRDRVIGVQDNPTNWDELRRLMGSRITESGSLPISWSEVGRALWDGSPGSVDFPRIGKSPRVQLLDTDNPVRASRKLKEWVGLGRLVAANPLAVRRFRKYSRPGGEIEEPLFSRPLRKQANRKH